MISKTIPFTAASISTSGDLQLPVDCRFEGANEIFVWRNGSKGNVILSAEPPQMSWSELFEHHKASQPKDEQHEVFMQYLANMFPTPSPKHQRKRASTDPGLKTKDSSGK